MALQVSNTLSTIQSPVNFVLMRGLLSAAKKVLPYYNNTLPGKLENSGNGSKSVKWRRIENLAIATTALSEHTAGGPAVFGLGRSAVQPTITDVTKAIAKHGNAILTTEEVDLFNVNSNTMSLMDTLGANAGESLNVIASTEYLNATNIRLGAGVASEELVITGISVNDIKFAVNQLNRQSAMKTHPEANGSTNVDSKTVRTSYFGICHSDIEEDIRLLTGFVGVEQYGGYTSTFVSEFGAVGGVRWSSTEMAPIETGAGTTSVAGFRGATPTTSDDLNDLYSSFIYGREAVGTVGLGENHAESIYKMYDRVPAVELIQHKPGSSGIADMFDEMGSIAWKAWVGVKILNDNWIINVRTLASDLS